MVPLKIFIILFICILLIYFNYDYKKYIEPLEDIGDPEIPFKGAPLAYKNTTLYLKNPLLENSPKVYQTITQDEKFNSDFFYNNDNGKYYNDGEMNMDFRYFNNASNLSLYHFFNPSTKTS